MKPNLMLGAIAFLLALSSCCRARQGQDSPVNKTVDASLLKRFNSEAPEAWQKAKNDFLLLVRKESLQVDVVLLSSSGEKKYHSATQNLGQDYGLLNDSSENGDESVALYNKSYFALLHRKKGSSDWTIDRIGRVPEHAADTPLHKAFGETDVRLVATADPLWGRIHPYGENPLLSYSVAEKVKTWADLRDREIISLMYVDYDGKQMVGVEMNSAVKVVDWENPNEDGSYGLIDKTWRYKAVFDPANQWCLREVSSEDLGKGDPVEIKKIFAYSEIDGVQRCESCTSVNASLETKAVSRSYKTFSTTKVNLSPEDFTLTTFGLSEPDWYRAPNAIPSSLLRYLIGLALVIAGGVVFWFGKKN